MTRPQQIARDVDRAALRDFWAVDRRPRARRWPRYVTYAGVFIALALIGGWL